MDLSRSPTIYLIGNPTRDKILIGEQVVETLGGTVLYAALLMSKLGCSVAVVGKGDRHMRDVMSGNGIQARYFQTSSRVTEFENDYRGGRRRQKAKAGETITLKDVPPEAFAADALLIGAVLREVTFDIVAAPRQGVLMLDAQGFLRRLSPGGAVSLHFESDARRSIRRGDLLKVDEQEARVISGTWDIHLALQRLYRMGPRVVLLTLGKRGAWVYEGRQPLFIEAPVVDTVDPTGAGDVFTAAFVIKYLEGVGLEKAARFAAAAAALSTRSFGTSGIPYLSEINSCLRGINILPGRRGPGERSGR